MPSHIFWAKLDHVMPWKHSCALLALALTGCTLLRPARSPLSTHSFVERGADEARGVIVMLPGYGNRPSDFDNHEFAEHLARFAPDYDLVAVDLHFNYYRKGRALARLEEDVIGPLQAEGYRELWILGVSMGGLGAVLYARAHSEDVTGLLLFAPFWGRGKVMDHIAAADSLCSWDGESPEGKLSKADRAFLRNWQFLRQVGCAQPPSLPIWVAYGDQDPPPPAALKLVDRLPGERRVELPGDHSWRTWVKLLDVIGPRAFATEGGGAGGAGSDLAAVPAAEGDVVAEPPSGG